MGAFGARAAAPAAGKRVLTIGLDPTRTPPAAPSAIQGPPPSQADILAGVEQATAHLKALGFQITNCMIAGENAEAEARAALRAGEYDIVVVGAGLRLRTDMFFLFERILNAVHELAPKARIALHTTPVDFDEAVIRVSGDGK
jgi:hypothetical protein